MPRFIASSASSCWLQWLTGRSLSDGRSQASATIEQICSGVIRAGAPERGASLKRSSTEADEPEEASQRARHSLIGESGCDVTGARLGWSNDLYTPTN